MLFRSGRFITEQPSQLLGWARAPSVRRTFGEYFDFELSEVSQGGQTLPVQGAVRVYYFPRPHDPRRLDDPASLGVSYGARLSLSASGLRRSRNFLNPGGFDYEAYLRRQGIDFTGVVQAQKITRLPGREGYRWDAALYGLRDRKSTRLNSSHIQKSRMPSSA